MPHVRFLLPLLLVPACAPSHILTTAEVPQAKDLGDIMWAQAEVADPAFKKIGRATYTDADYAQLIAVAERLAVTVPTIKTKAFSKGPAFDVFADALGAHAAELAAAASAKDPKASSEALAAMKNTCKSCHQQFK